MRLLGWTIPLFLLLWGILGSGCQKKHPNFTPPPAPPPLPVATPAPELLPEPPEIQPEPAPPEATLLATPDFPPPPSAPQTQRPRRRQAENAAQPQAPEVPAQPPSAAEPPRLRPLTTPEQERDLNPLIDEALARAEANLRVIGNRNLTKEQEASVAQVKSFIRQARDIRKSDLSAARSLAQRADILAGDLARSLR